MNASKIVSMILLPEAGGRIHPKVFRAIFPVSFLSDAY